MARKQRAGKSDKAQYTAYKSSGAHAKNKVAKLTRYVLANPNDMQSAASLNRITGKDGVKYTRNKFGTAKGTNGHPLTISKFIERPQSLGEQMRLVVR